MAGFLVSVGFLISAEGLLFWKYLDMMLTSLFDFARRGGSGGTLLIVTGTGLFISLLFLLVVGVILEENLDKIFTLSVEILLSVYNKSQLAWYIDEIKFQIESLIPSKSDKLFALDGFTFLLTMYLAIKFSKSLMFLVSDAICSIDL